MEIRRAPLPPDLTYFLDGAIESWEIGAFTYDTVSLFGETAAVDAITNGGSRSGWSLRDRQSRCLDLDAYAHKIAAALGERWRRALVAAAIPYEIKIVHDLAQICANWNYEDETTGGALLPWLKVRRCDDDFEPTKGLRRRLFAPSAIRRYVKACCQREFAHTQKPIDRLRQIPWPDSLSEGQLIADAREEALLRHRRLVEDELARMAGAPLREAKAIAKPERKKLIRAASIASAVVGEEKVRRFAAGAPVEIEGEAMILEARPRGSLTRHTGHGQIEVTVKNKASEPLGKLCVYFDGTAALDQLAALALHVQSGNESDVLAKGNLYAVTAQGAMDPLLSDIVRQRQANAEANAARWHMPSNHELMRRAHLRYFSHVGAIYIDAVAVHMWGRHAARLREYIPEQSRRAA